MLLSQCARFLTYPLGYEEERLIEQNGRLRDSSPTVFQFCGWHCFTQRFEICGRAELCPLVRHVIVARNERTTNLSRFRSE